MKHPLLLSIALSSTLTTAFAATNFTTAEQTEMVTAHNKYRTEVTTPAIKWSTTIADTGTIKIKKSKTKAEIFLVIIPPYVFYNYIRTN